SRTTVQDEQDGVGAVLPAHLNPLLDAAHRKEPAFFDLVRGTERVRPRVLALADGAIDQRSSQQQGDAAEEAACDDDEAVHIFLRGGHSSRLRDWGPLGLPRPPFDDRFGLTEKEKIRMKQKRAYQYRCYPTSSQRRLLARTFGCVRFVYNWALRLRSDA